MVERDSLLGENGAGEGVRDCKSKRRSGKCACGRTRMESNIEKVWFRNSLGQRLAGWYHWAEGSVGMAPSVILCHGMMSSKEGRKQTALAHSLQRNGLSVFRFDFSFCGESEGRFEEITFTQEVDDLRHAVETVRQRGASSVGLLGSSMGGAVTLLYARDDPDIKAIVTVAAVASPARIVAEIDTLQEHMVRWIQEGSVLGAEGTAGPLFFEDARRQDVIAAVRSIRAPLLVLHGGKDEVVPVGEALDIFNNASGVKDLRILPGADHRFTEERDLEILIIAARDWFVRYLSLPLN